MIEHDTADGDQEPAARHRTQSIVTVLGFRIAEGGSYERGTVLTIQQLTAEHGITRAMAREVLQILAEKRLVDLSPRVGAKIRDPGAWDPFDPDVIAWRLAATPAAHHRAMTELRAAVEPEAAYLAAVRAPATVGRELLSQFRILRDVGTREDFPADEKVRERYREADERFHTALLAGSQNEMFAGLVHPAVTALNHRIDRNYADRPHPASESGRVTPFPTRPEPLALWLHGAVAYAVDQKLPDAARTFARAILTEILHGVLDGDDDLHRDLEKAHRRLDPRLIAEAEYDGITREIRTLLTRHRTRRVASGPPIVVMGVAGSGKSTVGELLAQRLQAPFVEGDSRHPEANVAKMAAGEPLTDDDRWPWLDDLHRIMREAEGCVVVSCSALKRAYRDRLDRIPGPHGTSGRLGVRFVYLHLDPETAEARVARRAGHFMRSSLVPSQFAALERLEIGECGVRVDATLPVAEIIATTLDSLGRL